MTPNETAAAVALAEILVLADDTAVWEQVVGCAFPTAPDPSTLVQALRWNPDAEKREMARVATQLIALRSSAEFLAISAAALSAAATRTHPVWDELSSPER